MTTTPSNDPRQRAIDSVRRLLRILEPRHVIHRAIVGDGVGTVAVSGWTGYYWVRLVGKEDMLVQAYCDTLIPANGMHVNVEEERRSGQRFYRIVGRPDDEGWFTDTRDAVNVGSPVAEHHVAHETGGDDMINVGATMIENLRGGPTDPASMSVRVSWAPHVTFGRDNKPFPGDGTTYKDSAAITAPTWGQRFDLVSIDSDLDINITTGTCAWADPDPPSAPANELPVCWVLVRVGDTALPVERFWPATSLHTVAALHAADHQDGGADEISVAGLSGELADPQPPKTHASDHENGGGDEISVAGLSGELADPQPPKAHASDHESGGGDEISVAGLLGVLADAQNADKLQGRDVSNAAPNDAQVLAWDDGNSYWEPADTAVPSAHAATHENGGGDEISVAGLSGVLGDKQDADKLQGRAVASDAPSDEDVLTWDDDASEWVPAAGGGGAGVTDVLMVQVFS